MSVCACTCVCGGVEGGVKSEKAVPLQVGGIRDAGSMTEIKQVDQSNIDCI